MKKTIKTVNYDGKILNIEVSAEIYEFDKKISEKIRYQERRRAKESTYEQICEICNHGNTPKELTIESAESEFIKLYQIEQLYEAIESLPETQKRRIILRFFNNLSLQEIADIENCDISSVRTLINRGLRNLRNYIEKFF